MRIGVAINDEKGLESQVSAHFGRCLYYLILEVKGELEQSVEIIPNPYFREHGQPGQVPSFLKEQQIEVIICGGMGPRALSFFREYGIKVVTGATGKAKDAVDDFLQGKLAGEEPCH